MGIDWPFDIDSFADIVNRVLPIIYGLAGLALFILIIYGGYTWLTSAGDPDKVRKGMDTLVNAVIGIVIVAFAWAVTRIVFGLLGGSLF